MRLRIDIDLRDDDAIQAMQRYGFKSWLLERVREMAVQSRPVVGESHVVTDLSGNTIGTAKFMADKCQPMKGGNQE